MVTVGLTMSKKSPGHTNIQTNKLTRESLCKADSHTGLIAFHIQLPVATLASLTYFIFFSFQLLIFNLIISTLFSNLDRSTVPKFFLFLTVFEDFVTSIIIMNQFVRYDVMYDFSFYLRPKM